jgi:D-ribose pyranase
VDLAFRAGVPSFEEVLDGLLAELVVEGATAASEVREREPEAAGAAGRRFPDALTLVSHERLKEPVGGRAADRTDGRGAAVRECAAAVRGVLLEV